MAGFSIIVAMGLVVVITLMVLVLLEAMVPFARGTKGIEESVAAYYIAESGIEEGILYVTENGVGDEDADPLSAASEDF
ncbi:MAG: hypothetical protein H6767_05525 [Candidatus Peribacteria bacterium]|nr:MAG: hypothetical protein H6767_05525 [Candidatus Peribacteria bacterium]